LGHCLAEDDLVIADTNGDMRILIRNSQIAVFGYAQQKFDQKQTEVKSPKFHYTEVLF